MYDLGIIGNCQISALVNNFGSIDWLCLPRPDSPPVFGKLLDKEGGEFSISLFENKIAHTFQYYLENTNILVTELTGLNGSKIRITDFCPRFYQFGRIYRPCSVFRIVEPLNGSPQVQVKCTPIDGWQKNPLTPHRGNSHIRYDFENDQLRLITNMSLTYLLDSVSFQLKEKYYFALTWGNPIEEDLGPLCEIFLLQTKKYWEAWVKHCSIPTLFQKETIRSALVLKLHCYEDTGAILAATTTSLPEEIGGVRNWDYRFCWPRDAHFVLSAFHSLGHFEEMEDYLKFLLNIAQIGAESKNEMSPVYSLSKSSPLPEIIHSNWAGYKNSRPVRTNNQAAEHIQNDIYGEMILTLAPIYFDERFVHLRTLEHSKLMIKLCHLAKNSIMKPDAGLWEVRDHNQIHAFTHLMIWAGLERINRLCNMGHFHKLDFDITKALDDAKSVINNCVFEDVIKNATNDPTLDASLLLAAILRFPDLELTKQTVHSIYKLLQVNGPHGDSFFYRYLRNDDFGKPKSAFVICSFWMAQALAIIGENEKASQIFKTTFSQASNHLGLFSEHFENGTKTQLGNFPQAYSHVGLINAAFSISPSWSSVL